MSDKDAAMRLALSALECMSDVYCGDDDEVGECASCHERSYKPHHPDCKKNNAITALRAALAAQEPTRKAATQRQILAVHRTTAGLPWFDEFERSWKAAERFHGIGEDET